MSNFDSAFLDELAASVADDALPAVQQRRRCRNERKRKRERDRRRDVTDHLETLCRLLNIEKQPSKAKDLACVVDRLREKFASLETLKSHKRALRLQADVLANRALLAQAGVAGVSGASMRATARAGGEPDAT